MEKQDIELAGRLVYLTVHMDVWLRQVNSKFNVPMANRLAKIVKVFDWETDEGKLLLAEREKSGKWKNLNPKAFKFVLKIYYPDLKLKDKQGLTVEELVPRYYPGTELFMFDMLPSWMLKDLQKEEKDIFKIENTDKTINSRSKSNVSKRISKKSK